MNNPTRRNVLGLATRPGHTIPGWTTQLGDEYDHVTPSEIDAEAKAMRFLERVQWFSLGAMVGCFTLWATLVVGGI